MSQTFNLFCQSNHLKYEFVIDENGDLTSVKVEKPAGHPFVCSTRGETVEVADTRFRIGENWRSVPTNDDDLRKVLIEMIELYPPKQLNLVS